VFGGTDWSAAAGIVYTTLLLLACVTDVRSRRIPNWLVALLAGSGFAFSMALESWWPGLARAFMGLVVGFSIWIVFHVAGGLGAGDVKLFAAAGAWLGPGGAWRAALVAAFIGGVLSVGALVWQRRTREGFERVAMSLSMFSLAPLGQVEPGKTKTRKAYLPYGVALACGALVTGWIPGILESWR